MKVKNDVINILGYMCSVQKELKESSAGGVQLEQIKLDMVH